jgi:hypothetical protein
MPDRLATQAAIKRATLAAQRAVVELDAAALKELKSLYQQAADEIARRIADYSGSDGNVSNQEMQSVLDQVSAQLKLLARLRDDLLNQSLSSAVELGTQPLLEQAALSVASAMQINHEALQFVRTFVAEDGLQLSDRIWRLDRQARDTVTNAIEMAVIQGQGAAQAAREFLARGEVAPIDIRDKIDAANASKIGKATTDALLTGDGSPMDNAMRVFRTEINRAHGEAYIKGALAHPEAAGVRFKLSPGHPKPDICDLHAHANLHGLGAGVYPNRESCPWPAHPNTISFVEVVFSDEVTAADRAGKETPMQALGRLTPAQQIGVLGKNKHQAFKDGRLTQGMIKAPWSSVKKRIGIETPNRKLPVSPSRKPSKFGLDDYIKSGKGISDGLLTGVRKADGTIDSSALLEKIHRELRDARPVMTPAIVQGKGKGADLVRAASQMFPDDWTNLADKRGPLYAKFSDARGKYVDIPIAYAGRSFRFMGYDILAKGGEGFIQAGK